MSTIKANTLLHSDGSTTTQPSIPALDKRMAKAWLSMNGTGTVAINDSYNISSITDGGAGVYQANLTTAMSSTNFSVALSIGYDGSVHDDDHMLGVKELISSRTTSVVKVLCNLNTNGGSYTDNADVLMYNLIVFGA